MIVESCRGDIGSRVFEFVMFFFLVVDVLYYVTVCVVFTAFDFLSRVMRGGSTLLLLLVMLCTNNEDMDISSWYRRRYFRQVFVAGS